MTWNLLAFFAWTLLGIVVWATGQVYPWWFTVVLIFMLAGDNLVAALQKAFPDD